MDISEKVRELGLGKHHYVVVAGGVLVALGLLEWDDDIDICVTPKIFERFKNEGWRIEDWHGKPVLKHDVYDIGIDFWKWSLADLQADAMFIQGVPFMSLDKLLEWKKHMSRPKDLKHVKLIEQYRRGL